LDSKKWSVTVIECHRNRTVIECHRNHHRNHHRNLVFSMVNEGVMWRLSQGIDAKITRKASAIIDRHVWADKHRDSDVYCSDAFMSELKSRKMGTFDKVLSFVAQGAGYALEH
jgi:hypothetical protein